MQLGTTLLLLLLLMVNDAVLVAIEVGWLLTIVWHEAGSSELERRRHVVDATSSLMRDC